MEEPEKQEIEPAGYQEELQEGRMISKSIIEQLADTSQTQIEAMLRC